MKELLAAIKTKYNTDDSGNGGQFVALRAANTGGLYLNEQLQETAYPYMTLIHVVGDDDHIMGGTEIKKAVVQFSIFDEVFNTVMDIYAKLVAAFNNSILTYATDNEVVFRKINETGPFFEEQVWQVTVDFEAWRNT